MAPLRMKRFGLPALGLMIVAGALGCQKASAVSGDAGPSSGDAAQDWEPTMDAGTDASGGPSPVCSEAAQQSCASPSNPQVGACHAGVRRCEGGAWGFCSGEVLPAAQESCNGIDDNCNGMVDEGCAGCLVVCANCVENQADAGEADGSVARPFTSLEAAIAAAGVGPGRICVAGGNSCTDSWSFKSAAPIKLRDGLRIQGGYAVAPEGLVYCQATEKPRITLEFTSNQGVVFDEGVVTGAELSGFVVEVRPTGDNSETTAIAVAGARNVSLSRVFVSDGVTGTKTTGVSITAGGSATITGSAISTGQGQDAAFGVYVNGGRVELRNNCDQLLAGNCLSRCGDCGPMLGIRGFVAEGVSGAPARSSGIFITGTAGSVVSGNMICGGSSLAADPEAMAAAVVCEGMGCSTVAGNMIVGGKDRDTVGLALLGADPWVDGNHVEGGCGTRSTTGVWLQGSSARLQNNRLLGGQCTGTDAPAFTGLRVQLEKPSDSPDVHSNTIEPLGTSECQSVGVSIERSSSLAAATGGSLRNNIIGAGSCDRRTSVYEAEATSLRALANNDLYAPETNPPNGTAVLYHHAGRDAVSVAEVNAVPGASGNLSADPKYAAFLSDFHLTSGSACIDQGEAAGAPESDGDKQPRPVGTGFDIGAYEFSN